MLKESRISSFENCCDSANQIPMGLDMEINFKDGPSQQNSRTSYKVSDKPTITRKTILKLIFLVFEDPVIDCIRGHFELYKNHEAAFGFLYDLHKLQKSSEETAILKFKFVCKNHIINMSSII